MTAESKYPPCIFCGKGDSKPHKEDVLPKWIAREFGNDPWEIKSQTSDRTFKARNHLGLVSRAPCTQCNNGWMSKLESAAKPVIAPLMNDTPSELTPEQQLVIARWLVKTCIMHEVLNNDNPRYFRAVERKALMKHLAVPPITWVFLGRYIGDVDILTREVPMDLNIGEPENAQETYGYSATFAIKRLALQIFTVRPPKNFKKSLAFKMSRQWDRATVQIWPVLGTVNWPPPYFFDDEGFEILTDRWKTLKP
jgi:hypothetical protein